MPHCCGVTSETMVLQLANHTVVVDGEHGDGRRRRVDPPARARAGAARRARRATRCRRVEARAAAPGVGPGRERRARRRGHDGPIAPTPRASPACGIETVIRRGYRLQHASSHPTAVTARRFPMDHSTRRGTRGIVRVNQAPGRCGRLCAMTSRHVLVGSDGDITTITLDRPEKRNALALDVMVELTDDAWSTSARRTRSVSSSPPTGRSSRPGTTSATWPARRSTTPATCSRCARR